MLRITYKDEEYSWEEWQEIITDFNNSLELPDDFLLDPFVLDGVIMYDLGYSVALNILRETYYVIASARFNLMNSFNKFYESNIIAHGNSYISHVWMRSEYLKNSILLYNSAEDYVYQIIWFAFDMYSNPINSKESFQNALKSCNYKCVKEKLNKVNTDSSKELLRLINRYRFNTNTKYLRNNLANNLKHRANLQFSDLERTRIFGYEKQTKDGEVMFSSTWLSPEIIEIDEAIDKLVEIHSFLINFIRDVYKFIDIFDSFEINGGFSFNPVVPVKDIEKKIIFDK